MMSSFLLALLLLQPKAATSPGVHTVTSIPPIVTMKFEFGVKTYVIGADGIARTCPDVKGVGVFVRDESVRNQNAFVYVAPGSMIRSSPAKIFTMACLKIE